MKPLFRLALASIALVPFTAAPLQAQAPTKYWFIDLGTLGGTDSFANALNNLGQVVGDSTLATGETRGFLFTEGKMTMLGLKVKATGGQVNQSHANGINDSGQVVGATTVTTDGDTHACIFAHGAITDLGVFQGVDPESGSNFSVANAISAAGQIVGSSNAQINATIAEHAALFPGEHALDFDTTIEDGSEIDALNAHGQYVGVRKDDNNRPHAVIFVAADNIQDLPTLEADTFSNASGINDAGVIVGGSGIPGVVNHAFYYDGTMHQVPGGSGTNAYAAAINNPGDIVGNSDGHPFLYMSGTMYDLTVLAAGQLAGFTNIIPNAINDNGWIVGGGDAANGEFHAFLAIPTPVTTTLVAAKGDQVGKHSDSVLSVAGSPVIDAAGDVAFHAIVTGSGKNATNNSGILLYSGTDITIVAGIGDASNPTGDVLTKVSDPVMSGSGAVAFIGTLKVGSQIGAGTVTGADSAGIWVFKSGSANLMAQTGGTAPTGQGNFSGQVTFSSFSQIVVDDAGGIAFEAGLKGSGASTGLFATDASGNLQLLTAKGHGEQNAQNIASSFSPFVPLSLVGGQSRTIDTVNGNGALLGKFDPAFSQSIGLALSGADGFSEGFIVNTSGTVPNMPGVTYKTLDEPIVNAKGSVAFFAVLSGTGVNAGNNVGIGLATTTGTGVVVRTGTSAPDTTGTANLGVFDKLGDPVLNNNDRIAFVGVLSHSALIGVTGLTDTGIWSDWDGTMKRIARTGDTPPGFGGGKFSAFKQIVLPDAGGPVFLATLSGVPAVQNTGVWAMTQNGTLVNVVQTGDLLDVHGTAKTVKTIGIFQQAAEVLGQSRSFDASTANLVYQATFTDGTWGIYEVNFP